MNKTLPAENISTFQDRLRAVFKSVMGLAQEFLATSKFNPMTQKLIGQLSKMAEEKVQAMIDKMSEEEIRKQIYFVRDELIPFLLGEDEDKDTKR